MEVGPEGPINPHPITGAIPTAIGTNRHSPLKDRIIRPSNWRPPTLKSTPTAKAETVNTPLPVVRTEPVSQPVEPTVQPTGTLLVRRKKALTTKQTKQVINHPQEVKQNQEEGSVMVLRPSYKLTDELVSYVTIKLFSKTTMEYEIVKGDAVIFHARNILADKFMQSGCEWSLWWDDDMIPTTGNTVWMKKHIPGLPANYPDNFLLQNPINRLLNHGKSIVGGLYFGRMGRHNAICQRTTDDPKDLFANCPKDVLVPREWVGTGFLLVHRSVYEAIQQSFPDLKPNLNSRNHWERVWNYFAPTDQQAEDVSFCKRALAAGHQPYVDLGNVIFHLGTTVYGPWSQI